MGSNSNFKKITISLSNINIWNLPFNICEQAEGTGSLMTTKTYSVVAHFNIILLFHYTSSLILTLHWGIQNYVNSTSSSTACIPEHVRGRCPWIAKGLGEHLPRWILSEPQSLDHLNHCVTPNLQVERHTHTNSELLIRGEKITKMIHNWQKCKDLSEVFKWELFCETNIMNE